MPRKRKRITDDSDNGQEISYSKPFTRVVKCGLYSRLKVENRSILDVIDRWVLHISQITSRGSMIFNCFLIWGRDTGNLRYVVDEIKRAKSTFFWNVFTLGMEQHSRTDNKYPTLQRFWSEKRHLFVDLCRIRGDSQAIVFAANQYGTNFYQDLKANFTNRLEKFIAEFCKGELHINHQQEIEDVKNVLFQRKDYELKTEVFNRNNSQQIGTFIDHMKQLIGLSGDEDLFSFKYDKFDHRLQKNLFEIIETHMFMLKFFEDRGLSKKTFKAAPMSKFGRKHLTIDNDVMYYILKEANSLKPGEDKKSFMRIDQTLENSKNFRRIFDCSNLFRDQREEITSITTDGVSVCFRFTLIVKTIDGLEQEPSLRTTKWLADRKRAERKSAKKISISYKVLHENSEYQREIEECKNCPRVIAIDPGRSVIISAVEQFRDDQQIIRKRFQFSRKQYYHESHLNRNKKKRKTWDQDIQSTLHYLKGFSSKSGGSLSRFEDYLLAVTSHWEELTSHYSKRKYARMKFDIYISKRKSVDRFIRTMKGKGEIEPVIAYGNARFPSTGRRGERPVPVRWIRRRFENHYRVVDVDEYRTTKCCNDCGSELDVLRRIENTGKEPDETCRLKTRKSEVRGLKFCRSSR